MLGHHSKTAYNKSDLNLGWFEVFNFFFGYPAVLDETKQSENSRLGAPQKNIREDRS